MSQTSTVGFGFYRAGFNPEFLLRVAARRRAEQLAERQRQRELDRAERQHKLELRAVEMAEVKRLARERAAALAEAANAAAQTYRAMVLDAEISEIREELAKRKVSRRSFERIEELACVTFDVLPSELRSESKLRRIVIARQFISYWARRTTDYSLPAIGRLLGGRDHTTIMAAVRVYPEKRARMGRHLRDLDREAPK